MQWKTREAIVGQMDVDTENPIHIQSWKTREAIVGKMDVDTENPIRIQSWKQERR